jgi:hypothetical protein
MTFEADAHAAALGVAAGDSLRRIRQSRPLVHQITNFVVMNETANATLAIGALPVMAHAPEEVAEMATVAGALVLNIGTLTREWVDLDDPGWACGKCRGCARGARPRRRWVDGAAHR